MTITRIECIIINVKRRYKPPRKGVKTMARKKKNGNQNKTVEILVLITAVLNLIKVLVDIIGKLLE